jgi:hypothetical protein
MNRQNICYMILSFIMIATFIVIFFFTYVSKVEEKVVKDHVERMTREMFEETDLFLKPEQKDILKTFIEMNRPQVPDAILQDDKRVEEHNKKLLDKSKKIFSALIITGLIVIFLIYITRKNEKIDMKIVIRNSLIILFFVAVLEYLFVSIISQNYILVDSTLFKSLFFKKLGEYSRS